MKTSITPKCRIDGEHSENVTHLINGCKMLPKKEYTRRHDKLSFNVHYLLCRKYGTELRKISTFIFLAEQLKFWKAHNILRLWSLDRQSDTLYPSVYIHTNGTIIDVCHNKLRNFQITLIWNFRWQDCLECSKWKRRWLQW